MMASGQILVLFDIDGTLVQTLGAGMRGMDAAFLQLHGREAALEGVAVAGRPDRAIVSDAFRKLGIDPTEDAVGALRDAYLAHLPTELARPRAGDFGVLPGVEALLDALDARPDVTVGLLTGNFVRGATIKLSYFDLWRRFAFGAYGDHHHSRRDLVPIAVARANEAGIVPATVVVIGDTPLDIDCAHAHGALAVGVATGLYSAQALADAGADRVVTTLDELVKDGAWLDDLRQVRKPHGGERPAIA